MLLPDNTLAPVWACDGRFYYNSNSSEKVKLYITINDDFSTIEGFYDFGNWSWWNTSDYDYDDYENNELEISANNRNPYTSEYIKLTIDTDDDYAWRISFYKVQYKSTSSSSWIDISRTSSTYFSNYSDEREQGYYNIKYSDYWHKVISNFLKFAKKWYYRIYAKDTYWNTDYIEFNVGGSSSYDSNYVEINTNDKYPTTSEYVDLTIETDDDYVGKIYLTAKYKSSNSSSRLSISNTSSTYFSNRSTTWSNWYVSISSSNNGYKRIYDVFKFAKKWYYRIYAEDEDWNYDYIEFDVGWSSSSSNNIQLRTDDSEPNASEYVDLTVRTDSSYEWKVYFSAQYKSKSSSSWSDISRTSSTYFINRSTTWTNGYLTMSYSDRWDKTVSNIFKFAKKWYYRIIAEDKDGYSTYLDFNVWYSDTSPLNWFTQKEFESIERIYSVWPTLISKLRNEYPRLRNNTSWRNLSDELYENMWDVVHKRSNRVFKDYDDFDRDFRYRFTRTHNLMD